MAHPLLYKNARAVLKRVFTHAELCEALDLPPDALFDTANGVLVDVLAISWEEAAPPAPQPQAEQKPAAGKGGKKKDEKPVETPKAVETDWNKILSEEPNAFAPPTETDRAVLAKEIVALELVVAGWLAVREQVGVADTANAGAIVKYDYPKAQKYAEALRAAKEAAGAAK